jgi:uncharacterized protein
MSEGILLPSYSLEEILQNKVEIPGIDRPLPLFREYLPKGYYPFYKETGYQERLRNIINLTLETDIPFYANMNVATAKKLKQLLYIISQSVPFKPNLTKLAQMIDVHRNGKNKTKKQIAGLNKAYILKDDIEHGYMNTVPLWTFGFNYFPPPPFH